MQSPVDNLGKACSSTGWAGPLEHCSTFRQRHQSMLQICEIPFNFIALQKQNKRLPEHSRLTCQATQLSTPPVHNSVQKPWKTPRTQRPARPAGNCSVFRHSPRARLALPRQPGQRLLHIRPHQAHRNAQHQVQRQVEIFQLPAFGIHLRQATRHRQLWL